MVDTNFKVWLIEFNANPALYIDTTVQRDIIPRMVEECLTVVLRLHQGQEERYDDTLWDKI